MSQLGCPPCHPAGLQQQGGPGHLEQVLAPDGLPSPLQSVITHVRSVQNVGEFVPENLQYTNPVYQRRPILIIESLYGLGRTGPLKII